MPELHDPHSERARRKKQRDDHKRSLETTYGLVGHSKADKLYEIAWDLGHSFGLDEVAGYYSDLVQLVQ